MFNETVRICDESLFDYAEGRPEFKEFCNFHAFFYKFVIKGDYIDLRTIKLHEMPVTGKDQKGKIKEVKIEHERTISELIQYISDGNWLH